MSYELKNTLAKIAIVLWIVALLGASGYVIRMSIGFDINSFFQLDGVNTLSPSVVLEIRIILLMLAVSIIGGISFIIKDFYRSVKYANLYTLSYSDYRIGNISAAEFQKLVTVDIYMGRFNYTWVYWFFIQPILSSALGLIAFFIARSGLGVMQTGSTSTDITLQSLYMYAVFTFLAGFSSHKFIAWLDRLADKIFSTTLPERKEELRNTVISSAANDRIELRTEVKTTEGSLASSTPVAKDLPVHFSGAPVYDTESETGRVIQDIPTMLDIDRPSTKDSLDQTGFARAKMKDIR